MSKWRAKLLAFAIHFAATLLLGACAAALIFLVWFPSPFAQMSGGSKLFLLVVGCDLALGPLISLVIYDPKKSRRALLADYSIIAVVQLAAMVYGIYAVSAARPVYVVFAVDRFEVMSAVEIADEDLQAAAPPYRSRSLTGPRFVGALEPADVKEQGKVLSMALAGKDISAMPKYYVPYDAVLAKIEAHAQPLNELESRHAEARPLVDAELAKRHLSGDHVRWLPVKHRRGFWTALIDGDTAKPLAYLPLDPY